MRAFVRLPVAEQDLCQESFQRAGGIFRKKKMGEGASPRTVKEFNLTLTAQVLFVKSAALSMKLKSF